MDRRTVVAVILSLAIYYAWYAYRVSHRPPTTEVADTVPASDPTAPEAPAAPVVAPPAPPRPAPELVTVPFEMCDARGELSTDGGRLHAVTLPGHAGPYHVQPLYSWLLGWFTGKSTWPWRPYGPDPGDAVLLGEHAGGLATGAGAIDEVVGMTVVSATPGRIELVGDAQSGVEIRKTFVERRVEGSCAVDLEVTWTNRSSAPFTGETWVTVRDHVAKTQSRYESQRQPITLVDGRLVYGGASGAGCVRAGTQLTDALTAVALPGKPEWFGVSDRYFGVYAVPQQAPTTATLRLARLGTSEDAVDGGVWSVADPLPAGASRVQRFAVYLGPNQAGALEAVDPSLARAIDLGFWAFFGWPLLWLLRRFHEGLGSWGLSIISLTFLVKLIFFPLTQRSFVATQKMQSIQPELQKIREEYADDPTELNRRTMALMSERQVNPLSGCLPMLMQMPVWLALNQVMLTSVDLYHARFLYLRDLASADPTLVLPLIIMGLMWLQQQLTTTTNLDPAQQQIMRYMPFLFGLMFFAFPSGLAVYVFVNMTLSILQQWWIKRRYGGPAGGLPAAMPIG